MGRRHSLIALLTMLLVTLGLGGTAVAHLPEFDRGSARDRADVRREVTRWLRARQRILLTCEGCAGRGVRFIPRVVTGKGLTSIKKPHRRCHATGVVVNRYALKDLYRPYLEDAQDLVALGEDRLDQEAIEEILDDEETLPREKRRLLRGELGLVRKSAQVKKMDFEQRTDGAQVVKVTTSVAPFETRWVKIGKRWRLVGPNDLSTALELAVPQQDQ